MIVLKSYITEKNTEGFSVKAADLDGDGTVSAKDADGDKLTNAEEIKLGTSPALTDTDEDGLSDYDEVKKYKTDPLKEDTDDDGISDNGEIKLGLDPLKAKSDGKTSDSERTFEQKLSLDTELLKTVNSE